MATLTAADQQVEVTEDGYLVDLEDWTREIAAHIAEEEGVSLTDRHWDVITFVQDYYREHGESPTIRKITKGSDIGVSTKELYQLFPKGPGKKISRIAGTPKPEGCV